jgi:hypothetical protein
MSCVTELVLPPAIVGRHYQPFRCELIEDDSLVRPEIHMGTLEQIAKYRYFQISEIVCHLICRVASGMFFCAVAPYPGLYVVEPIDLCAEYTGPPITLTVARILIADGSARQAMTASSKAAKSVCLPAPSLSVAGLVASTEILRSS